jgi:hypothetical protein
MSEKSNALMPVLVFVAILLAPALLWVGTLAYRQFRLRSAIRACERDMIASKYPDDFPKDRVRVVRAAGCRAVPLIFDLVDESRNEEFILGCRYLLQSFMCRATRQNDNAELMALWGALTDLDVPESRAASMTSARAWWHSHAAEQHPWWKVWSRSCGGD